MREVLLNTMGNRSSDTIQLVNYWRNQQDNKALENIIKQHEFLIKKIVNFYNSYHIDHNILFIEGTMGLIHAVDKFDQEKNVKLSTYCYFWIKQFIQKYVLKTNMIVSSIDQLEHEPNFTPNLTSSYDEIYEDLENSYKKALNVAIVLLNNLEQRIFHLRYRDKLTLKEVAKEVKLSSERVRQIEKKIIVKLQENIEVYHTSIAGNITFFKVVLVVKLFYYLLEKYNISIDIIFFLGKIIDKLQIGETFRSFHRLFKTH